jgi:hypothetical protein
MKKSIAMFTLVLITSASFAQETKELKRKTEVPTLKTLQVESNQIDLGDEVALKEREVQVKVKNVGNTPIQLSKISTTAFLMVKSFPKEAIQPGQESVVVVKHIPKEDGQFLETLVVESDASNTMEVLKIFGTIADKEVTTM